MVSSALDVGLEDLLQTLSRLRREHAEDEEHRQWRAQFPADWPM